MSKPIAESVISPRLRHRLAEIEALVALEGDAVLVCEAGDLDPPFPRIVAANAEQSRMTGFSQGEIIGSTPRLFQGDDTSLITRNEIRGALAKRHRIRTEIVNRTKAGEIYWVEMDIVPVVDPDSGNLFFVSFQRDVTRRRRLEGEWCEAVDRAERAMAGRADFIAAAVQDVSAPLNAALAHLDLIGEGKAGPQGPLPLVASAQRALRSLRDRILSLPEIARIDAGASLPAPPSPLTLGEFAADLRLSWAEAMSRRGLHFEIHIAPGLPETVQVDAPHLRQLVYCLIELALRQTERGGIALAIEAEPDGLLLGLHDSGASASSCGLLPDLARRLAATLGARLQLETTEGVGSSWQIALAHPGLAATPRRLATDWYAALRAGAQISPPMPPPAPDAAENASPFARMRVLVASGDPEERSTLTRQLQALGARVDVVANGAQALILATAETPYDLVLADARLPVVEGADLARGLRTHEEAHGLPPGRAIGIIDGDGAAETPLLAAGMDLVLARPVTLGRLVELLSGERDESAPLPLAIDTDRLELADGADMGALLAVFAESLDQLEADLEKAIRAEDEAEARDILQALATEARRVEARGLLAALVPCRLAVGNGDWAFARRTFSQLGREAVRLRQAMDDILLAP